MSSFPILTNSENYITWSRSIQALLQAKDLWSYIEGPNSKRPADLTQAEITAAGNNADTEIADRLKKTTRMGRDRSIFSEG
jgi:hypothetical protein